jgi:hypothetical protein
MQTFGAFLRTDAFLAISHNSPLTAGTARLANFRANRIGIFTCSSTRSTSLVVLLAFNITFFHILAFLGYNTFFAIFQNFPFRTATARFTNLSANRIGFFACCRTRSTLIVPLAFYITFFRTFFRFHTFLPIFQNFPFRTGTARFTNLRANRIGFFTCCRTRSTLKVLLAFNRAFSRRRRRFHRR